MGRALIEGRPYAELENPRRTVGAVLESYGFHPARTGRDHLRVIATAAAISRCRIDEVLTSVGLVQVADRRVGGYSTGMRQRLAVAAALVGDPRVLVLDEPTSGLDPEGVAWMRNLLRDFTAEGRCVLLASHLLAEVVQVADRVVIIAHGRALRETDITSFGDVSELTVRVDDPESLARALTARHGVEVRAAGDSALAVRGVSAEEVGRTATSLGATIFELTSRRAGESLEELYLTLIGRAGGKSS
jgi:ABC-2 type transport system ATP-binding protein